LPAASFCRYLADFSAKLADSWAAAPAWETERGNDFTVDAPNNDRASSAPYSQTST
jgi:hypothetical protein